MTICTIAGAAFRSARIDGSATLTMKKSSGGENLQGIAQSSKVLKDDDEGKKRREDYNKVSLNDVVIHGQTDREKNRNG